MSLKKLVCVLIGILLIIVVGAIFWHTIYDFLWLYYLAPIEADAKNCKVDGVTPGYNPVNSLTYGLILLLALWLIYTLFKRLQFKLNHTVFVSLTPWIVAGSIGRVLEDLKLFSLPTAYLFISPLIYLVFSGVVLALILLGYLAEKKYRKPIENYIVLIPGLVLLAILLSIAFAQPWKNPIAVCMILGLALAVTSVAGMLFTILSSRYQSLTAYLSGTSIALFFAHLLDASATYVGIDIYHYVEKHPLPTTLIHLAGTASIMYPLKFSLVLLVIYLVDLRYKAQLNSILAGLIKLCVFILGIAPGIRDMVRVGIGV